MKNHLLIFYILIGFCLYSCSNKNSIFTEEVMKKNRIKTITTVMYNYNPKVSTIEDSTKLTTFHYDQQGRINQIIRHGIPAIYQPEISDYHTYKDNKAEIIRKDEDDNILSRLTYIRTDTSLTTEGYNMEGSLEWKRIEKYLDSNPKKPILIEWYDNLGNITDKHIYKYDDIGLIEVQRYQNNELKNTEKRINNDKYRLEFEGKDAQGIIYSNITIYDEEERLTETYFENFINSYFAHQQITYGDDGLRKEEITSTKSGEPERLIKYYYEKW